MDYKQIQELIKGFETSNITHLELEMDALKIKLDKQVGEVLVERPTIRLNDSPKEVEQVGHEVKSPLVGTYYTASSPNDQPFVTVGQQVKQGDTICIIEAMKIMNEITAPVSGIVEQINVNNGDVIGYDQVILTIV